MNDETVKDVRLLQELDVAVGLLKGGLRELQRIDGANDFYHLPLLTLASGFERLMKVIICFHIHEVRGSYPSMFPWKNTAAGHNLMRLLDDHVLRNCFSDNYRRMAVGRQDMAFLNADERFRSMIRILSDFGQAGRYYNLNVVKGEKPDTDSPEQLWNRLEIAIVKDRADWSFELMSFSGMAATFERVNFEIVVNLERFARALCRLFTIGELSAKARQAYGIVHYFLMISDEALGKTRY